MKWQTVRDPAALDRHQPATPRPPALPKKLAVGLDMATNTGVAFCYFDPKAPVTIADLQPVYLGQWDLSCGNYESGALRFVRFLKFLRELSPDLIFFENVRYTPPGGLSMKTISQVMARVYPTAEFIGALKGILCAYAEENNIPCAGLDIGEIKKRATGRGNANKEQMILAANDQFGSDFEVEGYENTGVDNVADAAFILVRGLELYAAGA